MTPSRPDATFLAWVLWGLAVALSAAGVVFVVLSRNAPVEEAPFRGSLAVLAVTFATVGALVASRKPANPIGWLLVYQATVFGFATAAHAYGVYAALTVEGALPAGEVMVWAYDVALTMSGYALIAAFLLFPDGRLVSRRWRPVVALAVVVALLNLVGRTLAPGPIAGSPAFDAPFGIGGTAGVWLGVVADAGELLFYATVIVAIASLVVRYRGSPPAQRQQLKWIAFAGAFLAVVTVVYALTGGDHRRAGPVAWLGDTLVLLGLTSFPVAIGVAILRYRLFDIDHLIRRTVLYATVTATLGGTYVGLVSLLGLLVRPAGGDLAVAASVLVVAGLFGPLRRRVQAVVDRTFDRAHYDASRTVAAFSERLREELDLDALGGQLVAVVADTMHPQHASLWLRTDG